MPYLNLGVLLGEAGRHADAAAASRLGIARCPPEALLHFNLAVALEDARQLEAAIQAYDRCLALDPTMADAHFNVPRLHDQLGRAKRESGITAPTGGCAITGTQAEGAGGGPVASRGAALSQARRGFVHKLVGLALVADQAFGFERCEVALQASG